MIHVIVGAQWGDEGKGKIVDYLSRKADCVVRFHGGNNAGHTIVNSFGKFPLHLIPGGIFHTRCRIFITGGTILDLDVLTEEIRMLSEVLPDFIGRVFISPMCHLILPYHKLLDTLLEEAKGKFRTGTTGRGISPTYADKVSYNGIRLFDLSDKNVFREKLKIQLIVKNKIISSLGHDPLELEPIYKNTYKKYQLIKKMVKDTFRPLQESIHKNKYILFEGAQGIFLDNDWGTYPYVTASNCISGNIHAGAGVYPGLINRVTGISKAYTTRVGEGPFPTELTDHIGDNIRSVGSEYGATTGRPRRCGWLDLVMLKFACRLNGFTDLVITKMDVLDKFKEIKVCIGYTLNGKKVDYFNCDAQMLTGVKPVYKILKGWNKNLKSAVKYTDLPKEAIRYINEITRYTGVPVSIISVGPERNKTISVNG